MTRRWWERWQFEAGVASNYSILPHLKKLKLIDGGDILRLYLEIVLVDSTRFEQITNGRYLMVIWG